MHGQIASDLLALTAILHFSGGLENPFSVYYVLIVAVGSILMSTRDAYLYAALATALWVGLLAAEAAGLLAHYNLSGFRLPVRYREPPHILAESLVLATSNLGVAYLASSVAARLREGERRLFQANASCELRADELHALNARLQELDRSRAQFIRLVTHELRAPVAAIASYLRLILDGYVPPERLHEIVGKSEQRAGEQLALIEDLLDLARVREAKAEAFGLVDLAATLRDVLDLMSARIAGQGVEVSVRVGEGRALVQADAAHIKEIWTNLISNAVKYTRAGGRVTVMLEADGTLVRGRWPIPASASSLRSCRSSSRTFTAPRRPRRFRARGRAWGCRSSRQWWSATAGRWGSSPSLGWGRPFAHPAAVAGGGRPAGLRAGGPCLRCFRPAMAGWPGGAPAAPAGRPFAPAGAPSYNRPYRLAALGLLIAAPRGRVAGPFSWNTTAGSPELGGLACVRSPQGPGRAPSVLPRVTMTPWHRRPSPPSTPNWLRQWPTRPAGRRRRSN